MKDMIKRLLLICCFSITLLIPAIVHADVIEQDNLKSDLQVEQVENNDTMVKVLLTLTNTGENPIENVTIKSIVPEGMTITDETALLKEVGRIEANTVITHEYFCTFERESVEVTPTPDPEDPTPTPDKEETTPEVDNSDKVETGDNNLISTLFLVIVACVLMILLLIKGGSKKSLKIMSFLVCFSVLASICSNIKTVNADTQSSREVSVIDAITIDNKTYTFESIINYEIPATIGTIIGTIQDAVDSSILISDATVQIYDVTGTTLIQEGLSNTNGIFEFDLEPGEYMIKISKENYVSVASFEIISNETIYRTYPLVPVTAENEEALCGGILTNAINGETIPDVTINIRSNENNTTGDILTTVTTDEDGYYEVSLPLGNYTAELIKEGFITNSYNIVSVTGNKLDQNFTLAPDSTSAPIGDVRVVLTWGDSPRDLDSHLVGPTANGEDIFHIYYSDKDYIYNDDTYASLDRDDITYFGPETTTIYKKNDTGIYSYYVHNYTDDEPSSTTLSTSDAKVEVYFGETLVNSFNVPTGKVGPVWHVFDFDAEGNVIIPINNFQDDIYYNGLSRNVENNSKVVSPIE